MQALHKLQSDFARALLDPECAVPGDVTSHKAKHPTKRFGVYRNNVVLSLIKALAGQFPAVSRLLGEERFRLVARAYLTEHPPHSPVLSEYGESFGDFLADFEPLQQFAYIPDVARLEWLYACAFNAPDAAPAQPDDLAAIAPEALPNLRVTLHPSLGLLHSHFPVVSIWHTNVADDEVKPVAIDSGGEDALVVRPDLEVEVRRLPPGALVLFERLRLGAPLGEAAERAAEAAPQFDLQLALTDLVQTGAITTFKTS